MFDLRSGGPCIHHIDACDSSRSPSNDPHDATHPEVKIKEEVLSHAEKNNANGWVYNLR